jgi:hypothetical protein
MNEEFQSRLSTARAVYTRNNQQLSAIMESLEQVTALKTKATRCWTIAREFVYTKEQEALEGSLEPQLIEPLFQQALSFVDRVLAEDSTYRQLRVDQLNLRLDLEEFVQLDQINDDEVKAGLFQVPFWEAKSLLDSDNEVIANQGSLASWVQAQSDQQKKLASWSTENAQQPLATGWEGRLSQHTLKLNGGFTPPAAMVPSGSSATDGNVLGGILSYLIADYNFTYVQKQLATQLSPVVKRNSTLTSRVAYLDADAGFRERRKIAAHQKLLDKLSAVQELGGPLNYAERLAAIEQRAAFDLRHAYARMRVVERGISRVYGLKTPELPLPPQTKDEKNSEMFLNDLVLWLRTVGNTLQSVYNNDQDIIIKVSIHELLGGDRFKSGRKAGVWEFELTPDRFRGLRWIRLRGLSATAEHCGHRGCSLIARVPEKAAVIYDQTAAPVSIEQHGAECWLGRVDKRDETRPPDISGAKVLMNLSPVGTWSLRAAPGHKLESLDDVELALLVAAQAS